MDAGYSGTPLAKKLGIKPGARFGLLHPPSGWSIPDLPENVAEAEAAGPADVLVAFYRDPAALADELPNLGERIRPAGSLWIAWPRKAAGHVSDMDENLIRDAALPRGLVDVKVAALDTDWSGLKLVWRKELR
jgi:hypothetical protein